MRVPTRFVVRDVTALAAWISCACLDRFVVTTPSAARLALGIVTGVLAALVGFLCHEWGHLAGSLGTGSVVHFPPRTIAPLLFHFDTSQNTRRQFLAMSYGGYAGSLFAIVVIAMWARVGTVSGNVALVLAGVGTLVTFAAEVPTTIRVARGSSLPDGFAFRPPAGSAP